jgi:hypothetical protein
MTARTLIEEALPEAPINEEKPNRTIEPNRRLLGTKTRPSRVSPAGGGLVSDIREGLEDPGDDGVEN